MLGLDRLPTDPLPTTSSRTQHCDGLPVDRSRAEAAVIELMNSIGISAAPRFVWCNGPLELIQERQQARSAKEAGPSVLPIIVNDFRSGTTRFFGGHSMFRPGSALPPLHSAIAGYVAQADAHRTVGQRLKSLARAAAGWRQPQPWNSVSLAGLSQFDAAWLETEEVAANRNPSRRATAQRVQHARTVVAECGWFVPHLHTCWLCERPTTLHLDEDKRLHCADGPALAYRDGWKVYAWKGVRLPAALIEAREKISVAAVNHVVDPMIRRCMIELMTPEKFVSEGGAVAISRDETGVLWLRRWRNDAWAAVEVRNGSAEPDGTFKTYFLQVPADVQSARQAVAWTYHIDEGRYANLGLRT